MALTDIAKTAVNVAKNLANAARAAKEAAAERADAPAHAAKPAPAGTRPHTVRPGDTVQSIAQQHGITPTQLYELNPEIDPARRATVTLAQAGEHWEPQYVQDIQQVYVPLTQTQVGALAKAVALGAAQAAVESAGEPYEQVRELQAQADAVRKEHGEAAARELVANYIADNPAAFAEGYTLADAGLDERSRDTFAAGLDQAYRNAEATSPFAAAALTQQLAEGGLQGEIAFGVAMVASDSGGIADLVGNTGNDSLQAGFVTASLNAAQSAMADQEARGVPQGHVPIERWLGKLGLATEGSSQAAAAAINWTSGNSLFGHQRGVESLQYLLQRFSGVSDGHEGGTAYTTFLEAAVPPDSQPYSYVSIPNTPLTDQQSATLFLAITSDDSRYGNLLEADGANGEPVATEITARLYRNYSEQWIDPNGLNLAGDGTFGTGTGFFEGVNVKAAYQHFFEEALIDLEEAGGYREELTRFVVDQLFQGFDPKSDLAKLFGEPTLAAAHSSHLLSLLGLSELGVLKDIQNQSAETQRMLAFAVGILGAAAGAAVGGVPAAATSSKAAQAVLSYLIGQANGSIQGSLVDYLKEQGIDPAAAEQVHRYVLGGDPAELRPLLSEMLGNAELPPEVIEPFIDEFLTTLNLPLEQGGGFANALEAAFETLDNRPGALTKEQIESIRDALDQLQQALT